RIVGRQIPPQLVFLAQHERKLFLQFGFALPGLAPEYSGIAGCGMEYSGEDFQRRGFAGAARSQRTDESAGSDFKRNIFHRSFSDISALEQTAQRARKSGFFNMRRETARQIRNGNCGHGRMSKTRIQTNTSVYQRAETKK